MWVSLHCCQLCQQHLLLLLSAFVELCSSFSFSKDFGVSSRVQHSSAAVVQAGARLVIMMSNWLQSQATAEVCGQRKYAWSNRSFARYFAGRVKICPCDEQ
jgi:hypothetical protein